MDHLPTPYTRLPFRSARPLAGVGPEPCFRVGDVERSAACDALAEHYAAGRLDPAELEDRLARAVGARSQADLQVLFTDLRPLRSVPDPAVAPAPPAAEPHAGGLSVALLVSLVVLCLLLAGGMLLTLGAYSQGLFVAALVGGTATAVAGGCLNAIGHATARRR